jgi:ligand-binding SRPBCC domain-containing protein
MKAIDDGAATRLKEDTRTLVVDATPAQAFAPVRRIGGAAGWYFGNALWTVRGWLDRSLGGVGMNRGRRDPEQCAVGDVIDGWTVEACEPDRRLRLSADLKLPGRGWLEFEIMPLDDGRRSRIRQTATFDPRGLMGRAYWYAILPIHNVMFGGMLRRIARQAAFATPPSPHGVFTYRSVMPARANDVFRWHERPEALLDLIPSRKWIRIEKRAGGLRNGGCVTLSFGIGPIRLRWEARHYGYLAAKQFCDEQVRGPFRTWRHTHRFEPISDGQSSYEDRVEYAVPGGLLAQRLAEPLLRPLFGRAFARRHQTVREAMLSANQERRDGAI